MSRVFIFVSQTWIDGQIVLDWLRKLPRGTEVLYRRAQEGEGEIRAVIEEAGAAAVPLDGRADELPSAAVDAVLVFAGGRALGAELLVLHAAWLRRVRATLIPPAVLPARAVSDLRPERDGT